MDNKLCLIVLDFKCLATTTIIFTHCACHSHSTENTSIIYTVHLSFVPTLWNRYLRVRFPSSQVFRLLVHEPVKKLAHAHKYSPWEVSLYLKFESGITKILHVCESDCILIYRQDNYAM